MNEGVDPRAARLERFLRGWLASRPGWQYATAMGPYGPRRTVPDIAGAILADAAFAEVRLAGWFASTDGDLVRSVVVRVLPLPASVEVELLVEAVTRAAEAHQRRSEVTMAVWTAAAVATVVMLARPLLAGGSSRS